MKRMNIIKLGGSILNPDGKYDLKVIDESISLVRQRPAEAFIFIVGGGRICRHIQEASRDLIERAIDGNIQVSLANDWLGIAVTHMNCQHLISIFSRSFGDAVCPEVILDPTRKPKGDFRIFFTGGWKPGCSTDKNMMLLAKAFRAKRVFKITDFEAVKRISPVKLAALRGGERAKALKDAEEIRSMSWKELAELVGTEWRPGLNTPFDPEAAKIGCTIRGRTQLYIGKKEELNSMLDGLDFKGTVVRG